MTLKIGSPAPSFSLEAYLPDGNFGKVQLSDYKGKWVVLFFYPLDFTFVCPTEIRGFNAQLDKFTEANAVVLGASIDSKFSHKAWVESSLGKVSFPLLSDLTKSLSADYGVLREETGFALRGTFIIDPDGVLKSLTVNDASTGRSIDETLRTLQAFQAGGMTGCGWKPGDRTI